MTGDHQTITSGTYRLDSTHSNVGFSVMHKVSRFRATFADAQGVLVVDESGAISLTGSASVASLQVKNPHMFSHMQTPDFFDAEQYPEITFRSTSVQLDDAQQLTVTGDLTIRGLTRPVAAAGTLLYMDDDGHGKELIGVDLETNVDRHDFGLSFSQLLPSGVATVADTVTLTVDLEFLKG